MEAKLQCLGWVVVGRMGGRVIVIGLEEKSLIGATRQGGSMPASNVVIQAMLP
jgi:hypothetical protein